MRNGLPTYKENWKLKIFLKQKKVFWNVVEYVPKFNVNCGNTRREV